MTFEQTYKLVVNWANNRNLIDGSSPQAQYMKLIEEAGELAAGIAKQKPELVTDSVGDVLVVLAILCEQLDVNLLECFEAAYGEIKDRRGIMVNGIYIKSEDLHEGIIEQTI